MYNTNLLNGCYCDGHFMVFKVKYQLAASHSFFFFSFSPPLSISVMLSFQFSIQYIFSVIRFARCDDSINLCYKFQTMWRLAVTQFGYTYSHYYLYTYIGMCMNVCFFFLFILSCLLFRYYCPICTQQLKPTSNQAFAVCKCMFEHINACTRISYNCKTDANRIIPISICVVRLIFYVLIVFYLMQSLWLCLCPTTTKTTKRN